MVIRASITPSDRFLPIATKMFIRITQKALPARIIRPNVLPKSLPELRTICPLVAAYVIKGSTKVDQSAAQRNSPTTMIRQIAA